MYQKASTDNPAPGFDPGAQPGSSPGDDNMTSKDSTVDAEYEVVNEEK